MEDPIRTKSTELTKKTDLENPTVVPEDTGPADALASTPTPKKTKKKKKKKLTAKEKQLVCLTVKRNTVLFIKFKYF
jgi:hypothetical protein